MNRDIDYAAQAVKRAILEKFGDRQPLADLSVAANERTISIQHGERTAESTRDRLMAAIRDATSYADLWKVLPGL